MESHKDLEAWKKSVGLAETIYRKTSDFPREEVFGLTNQMRRAAVSVPSNIAEGAARMSRKEFAYFLRIALGSLAELETQCLISIRLKFLKDASLAEEISLVKRIVYGLLRSLKRGL